ncbi:PaaX family transcriptional regulator [Modestobacter sp. SYSU DS0875]
MPEARPGLLARNRRTAVRTGTDGRDEPGAWAAGSRARSEQPAKPQELLLAFLGALVLDVHPRPVPTSVFIDALAACGTSSAATRSALTRLVERGLLVRGRVGRVTEYGLTGTGLQLLREGEARVLSPHPFDREGGEWTLISFSMPETRRDARQRLRSRLMWAGFGCLRDGLWIAPGLVDLAQVGGGRDAEHATLDAFVAQFVEGTDIAGLIRRAWDIPALRAAHDRFIRLWDGPAPPDERAVPFLTALTADWLRLLRADPVLPTAHLPEDWPAASSAEVYRRVAGQVEPVARLAFAGALAAAASRR